MVNYHFDKKNEHSPVLLVTFFSSKLSKNGLKSVECCAYIVKNNLFVTSKKRNQEFTNLKGSKMFFKAFKVK